MSRGKVQQHLRAIWPCVIRTIAVAWRLGRMRAVCAPLAMFALLFGCVLLSAGCRHGGILGGRADKDVLSSFDPAHGYIVLARDDMRAAVRIAENAAVVASTQEGPRPTWMEYRQHRRGEAAGKVADRLLIGLSGEVEMTPAAWQLLEKDVDGLTFQRDVRLAGGRGGGFALSIQREIRLHGRTALDGFMTGTLSEDVQVSGYESRTFFTNPGPLPWPRTGGLPYIRIEGDFQRSLDTVLLLHVRGGGKDVVVRQMGRDTAAVGLATLGLLRGTDERRMVLPHDFVLPRLALLDRQQGVLTLIAFTPSIGAMASRDTQMQRPAPEVVLSVAEAEERWVRVVSSGVALPLATGGSTRHHRQTFHVRGAQDALLQIAAAFCRLPHEDVVLALAALTAGGDE